MTSLFPLTADLIRAFGWTLLHSFWQGFCIYACLRIVLKIWPQASAAIKYHLSCLSLAGIAGWFGATFFSQLASVRETQRLREIAAGWDAATVHAALQQAPPPQTAGLQNIMPGMEAYFPFLVAIYIAGVVFMTIRLSIDLSQLRQMRRQGVSSPGLEWDHYVKALAQRMGITRRVQLFISQHLQVPVMIGFLRPVILLPAAMFTNLSPEQLEAILLHELAHIKRNDYLLNIFQSVVETILFFNPFVWWISKNIRLEREHCCDDLVIAGTVQPLHYARALVALEEYRLTVNPMAMAAADDKHHLLHRIKRIMEMKTKNLNYSQRLLALLIIVTGLVSIAWLNPARKTDVEKKAAEKKEATADRLFFTGRYDTVPPAPPSPPAMKVLPPAPPPAPPAVDAQDVLPPLPPAAPTAPITATLAPMPPLPPLPPTDTPKHARKIVISDEKGTRTYNSTGEMTAEDRETYLKQQEHVKNYRQHYVELAEKMKVAQNELKKIDWSKMDAQIQSAMKNVDWNKLNTEMKETMKRVNREMAARAKDTDWEKIGADINKSLKDVQWEKLSDQIQQSLKSTDWQKIEREIREKMDKIDWKKIEDDIRNNPEAYNTRVREEMLAVARQARERSARVRNEALALNREARENAQRDGQRARMEAEKARGLALREAQTQREIAQKEAQHARREALRDAQQARAEAERESQRARKEAEVYAEKARMEAKILSKQARDDAERQVGQARKHSEIARQHAAEAKKNSEFYNEFLDKLAGDNLIDRDNFDIKKEGDDLFINGKKQPEDVKNRYKQYLQNKNVSIKGSKNHLNVDSTSGDNR